MNHVSSILMGYPIACSVACRLGFFCIFEVFLNLLFPCPVHFVFQGVGNTLKRHYETYLLEYELAHDDVDGECCLLCHRSVGINLHLLSFLVISQSPAFNTPSVLSVSSVVLLVIG